MAARFVNVDRDTPMLLPPDLRDWVADDDLALFILEPVEAADTDAAHVNLRGCGSRQYPPSMMLAVLIYCYATGRFSSRQIELATYRDVSVRYLSGNLHPDHDTICKFRRENRPFTQECFLKVLELARELGLLNVGTLCVDGTKLAAAASKRATLTQLELDEELQRLGRQIDTLLDQAETADGREENAPTALPRELADKQRRQARLKAAKEPLGQNWEERRLQRERERQAASQTPGKEQPKKLPPEPRPKDTINLQDPHSRLMPQPDGNFLQGYNAQLAVSAQPQGGLIVSTMLSDQTSDRRQLLPVFQSLPPSLGEVENLVADKGYDNTEQIAAIESGGNTRVFCPLNAPPSVAHPNHRMTRWRAWRESRRRQMHQRATSPEGRQKMRQRAGSVEGAIGIIKCAMGFTKFHLRGLEGAGIEWDLIGLAFNCRRISRRLG